MTRIIILGTLVAIAGIAGVAASDNEQEHRSLLSMLKLEQTVSLDDGPRGYKVRIWSEDEVTQGIKDQKKRVDAYNQMAEQQRKHIAEGQKPGPEQARGRGGLQFTPEEWFARQNPRITSIENDYIVFTYDHGRRRSIRKSAIVEISEFMKQRERD